MTPLDLPPVVVPALVVGATVGLCVPRVRFAALGILVALFLEAMRHGDAALGVAIGLHTFVGGIVAACQRTRRREACEP